MKHLVEFLIHHGYALLFAFVLAEQLGLPIPAVPVLLAMGALIGQGHFGFPSSLLLATLAAVAADTVWFEAGRLRGTGIIGLLCRLSLEPDSCARRTTEVLSRLGPRSLLVVKFVPGLSTAAPPMAGIARVPLMRFLLWDTLGSLLWSGAFLLGGYLFSAQLESALAWALRLGWGLAFLAGSALAAFLSWKFLQRRRFLLSLRVARITPEELKARLDNGEEVMIVDLRHPIEHDSDARSLPGALRYAPAELERLEQIVPLDRDVVLYCT